VKQCVNKPQSDKQKLVIIEDSHTRNSTAEPQQKNIIVIGDSHARGLASELKNCIGHEYSVSGTIPGARLNNITQLANNELTALIPRWWTVRITMISAPHLFPH